MIIRKILIFLRLLYSPFAKSIAEEDLIYNYTKQEASDYIKAILSDNNPVMIARFGSVELQSVIDYLHRLTIKNAFDFVSYRTGYVGYSPSTMMTMGNNAGFFPVNKKNLDEFAKLMLQSMEQVDVLGSWIKNEIQFEHYLKNSIKIPLGDLEPYFHENPWSEVLAGKKVLVIHPFKDTIEKQYANRDLLFEDKRVLPDFELEVIQAVQSIANNPCGFNSWFDALDYMKDEIRQRDFDIVIIGCGAYGFPLAAYVKSIGKKAIHLGGATQMMFGIKSKAWEDDKSLNYLINEYWVRPSADERPNNYMNVENGRYW